jgi:hypothetical protein
MVEGDTGVADRDGDELHLNPEILNEGRDEGNVFLGILKDLLDAHSKSRQKPTSMMTWLHFLRSKVHVWDRKRSVCPGLLLWMR